MPLNKYSDAVLRDLLEELDNDEDVTCSSQDAKFIENAVYNYKGPLSEKQRKWAYDILCRYESIPDDRED